MEHPIPLNELPPALHKFCDPSGPPPARMMAAKGMVPLKPADLIIVLYQLSHDPDEGVSTAAREKCSTLPDPIIQGALSGDLDARVLDFYATVFRSKSAFLQILMLNHATADETVARCAKNSNEELSEIIAVNEQRLLRFPQIIENLYHNKKARMSTVNRAIELAVRNKIVLDGIPAFKEAAAAIQGELIVEDVGPTPMDKVFAETLQSGEALEREAGEDAVEKELVEEAPPTEQRMSIQARLGKMTTSEKIRMALLGSASHRSILIRDTNKLVALATIKSPSVRESEVHAYCRNKALHEDVIRHICKQKDWTRTYTVKRILVENPKTPLPKALSFLTHLRLYDLKSISRSKNVPAAVAKAAQNQLKKRR